MIFSTHQVLLHVNKGHLHCTGFCLRFPKLYHPWWFSKKVFFLRWTSIFSKCYQDSKIYGVFSQFLHHLNPPPNTIWGWKSIFSPFSYPFSLISHNMNKTWLKSSCVTKMVWFMSFLDSNISYYKCIFHIIKGWKIFGEGHHFFMFHNFLYIFINSVSFYMGYQNELKYVFLFTLMSGLIWEWKIDF